MLRMRQNIRNAAQKSDMENATAAYTASRMRSFYREHCLFFVMLMPRDKRDTAHAHGDCVGACKDDEDKDEDVEDESGAAHVHGDCVGVPVKMTRTRTRT
jgi:hypothetical protein